MAKVLWIGDGGCHTGFGRVTHAIGERLVTEHGHDVAVLATNHRGDYWATPMRLYMPTLKVSHDIYGLSRFLELLKAEDPDVVVILNDAGPITRMLYNNGWDEEHILRRYRPIIAYIPVDGINAPPSWEQLGADVNRVAMSRFGQAQMPESKLVYHGVDSDLYRPVEERPITLSNGRVVANQAECKEAFGYDPDDFLVLRVDRNSIRKDFPSTIKALWPLLQHHKDMRVHFHCQPVDPQGYHLPNMLEREPDLRDRFYFPDNHDTFTGWKDEDLCALYNAADLFVSTTYGEGFGLTLSEAAACGTPIVAPNNSAIPEVAGPGAILVEPERLVTVPSGQDQWLPSIAETTAAIERLYLGAGSRRKLGAAGRKHIQESFSWDFAAERFHKFITALAR